MKRGPFLILLSIVLINSISAYSSQFSLGNFFNSIDSSTLVLGCLFMIFFAFLQFTLSKFFKSKDGTPNTTVSAVISFAISLLAVYGINKIGFNVEDLLYSMGLNEEVLSILIPLIFIIGFIFLLWKVKYIGLIVFGLLFILIAIATDWVYEKGTLFAMGIGLIVLGIVWLFLKKRKKKVKIPSGTSRKDFDIINRKELERERREADYQRRKREDAEKHKEDTQKETQREKEKSERKFVLARKIGIRNLLTEREKLSKEGQILEGKAKKLNSEMTGLGGSTPQKRWKNENDFEFEDRKKRARDLYNEWYRVYCKLGQIRNKMIEIDQRIEHLRSQLNR